jgi:hypothetical protein
MCSGKSRALINAHKRAPLDFDVYTFGKEDIVSRGAYAGRITANKIERLGEIQVNHKNLIIDECQFYTSWQIQDVDNLVNKYENVYLAGLDWIQEKETGFFETTDFYNTISTSSIHFPFLYTLNGLLAKNDITGELDARISKRYENATDILSKDSYYNINFKQAFIDKIQLTK